MTQSSSSEAPHKQKGQGFRPAQRTEAFCIYSSVFFASVPCSGVPLCTCSFFLYCAITGEVIASANNPANIAANCGRAQGNAKRVFEGPRFRLMFCVFVVWFGAAASRMNRPAEGRSGVKVMAVAPAL